MDSIAADWAHTLIHRVSYYQPSLATTNEYRYYKKNGRRVNFLREVEEEEAEEED